MGRLTLNILLSFAQFEREIISERTRSKMCRLARHLFTLCSSASLMLAVSTAVCSEPLQSRG